MHLNACAHTVFPCAVCDSPNSQFIGCVLRERGFMLSRPTEGESLPRQRSVPLCQAWRPTASLNWWNLATVVILVRKSAHCSCVLIGSSSTCCLFT